MVCLAAACTPRAAASSLTWGYDYRRDRATEAPVARDFAGLPPAAAASAAPGAPDVIPLPGASQSTPVVWDGTWYQWTYWDGGRRGALWTGGPAGPAAPVPLPGEPSATLSAVGGESFGQPADAAISPDGRWVAFGVGKRLYWWPAGTPARGVRVTLVGPGNTDANGSSPTFVPDPAVPSGWAVCDGNWNGAFECYRVTLGPFRSPLSWYFVTMTSAADGDGYAPITSSAAYDADTGDLYFGVASWHEPRVIRMDPLSGRVDVLGAGAIRAPVAAAVAVMGGGVYAADSQGDVYRFDAVSNALTAAYTAPAAAAAAGDIVSPAASARAVLVPEGDRRDLAVLSPRTLRPLGPWTAVPGLGGSSAVTVATDAGAAPEVFYGLEGGGVGVAALGGGPGGLLPLAVWPGVATDAGGYDYTAPVVDGTEVLLWSNSAARAWRAAGDPAVALPPPGRGLPPAQGGIQVYRMRPRASAFVTAAVSGPRAPQATLTVGDPVDLYVLQPPGASAAVAVTDPSGARRAAMPIPYQLLGHGEADCPPGEAPDAAYGAFPSPGGVWPPAGCGPLSAAYAALDAYAATATGAPRPAFAGLPPRTWRDASAGYEAWRAVLPTPTLAGAYAVDVTSQAADGGRVDLRLWYAAVCPAGVGADERGGCTVALTRPGCPAGESLAADGVCRFPPPLCAQGACEGSDCPPGVVPGAFGLTPREYALLCRPQPAWLTDSSVQACYGGWWAWASADPPRCGAAGTGGAP